MATVIFCIKLRDDFDQAEFQHDSGLMLERLMERPEFEFQDAKIYQAEDGEMLVVAKYGSEAGIKAWRDDPEHQRVVELGQNKYFESAWLGDIEARMTFDRVNGVQHPLG